MLFIFKLVLKARHKLKAEQKQEGNTACINLERVQLIEMFMFVALTQKDNIEGREGGGGREIQSTYV